MSNKDYYGTLGVDRNASESDIKSAFKRLSLKYHPDRQAGKSEEEKKEAEERFKEIAEAYATLSDKDKRKQYDTYGGVNGQSFSSMSMDEVFERFKSEMGFGPFGGEPFSHFNFEDGGNARKKGRTIKLNVHVSAREIYDRSTKTVTYERYEPCRQCHGSGLGKNGKILSCPNCGGTGMVTQERRIGISILRQSSVCPTCKGSGKMISDPCHNCGGNGLERMKSKIDIQIPNGCTDNSYMTIPKKGNYCDNGDGETGDLIVIFKLDDNRFEIMENGIDIMTEINVPVIDCVIGGEQYAESVSGKTLKFSIRQGTSDGDTYTLNGAGMPDGRGGHGKMYVRIRMVMPSSLTREDIKLLKKLKASKTFNI